MKQSQRLHKGQTYHITIDEGFLFQDGVYKTLYSVYVSINQPAAGLLYGELIRHGNGNVMLFDTELSALTNANAIIDSY